MYHLESTLVWQPIGSRFVCWYSRETYSYAGAEHGPCSISVRILDDLLEYLSLICRTRFNSILLNWYKTNDSVIGFHADDEPELGINPVIASLSLGDTREFFLRSRTTGQQRSSQIISRQPPGDVRKNSTTF